MLFNRDNRHSLSLVIVDIDGTLYSKSLFRVIYFIKLLFNFSFGQISLKQLKILREFRKSREIVCCSGQPVDEAIRITSGKCHIDNDFVLSTIQKWMYDETLGAIYLSRRRKAIYLLKKLRMQGIQVACLTDYPAEKKLHILQLSVDCTYSLDFTSRFSAKPNSAGLAFILRTLNCKNSEAIYVGDRLDTDREAAVSMGVDFIHANSSWEGELRSRIFATKWGASA